MWLVGTYLRFHSFIELEFEVIIVFRFDDRDSHMIKIKNVIEIMEIYLPVEEIIFHILNESE